MATNSFVITGLGRSGTLFLATHMNVSSLWTVLHEPAPSFDMISAHCVQDRFDRDNYGEVNSYLRMSVLDLRVARRGVILRDPRACLLSAQKRGKLLDQEYLDYIDQSLHRMDAAIRQGAMPIRFEKMVSSHRYLADLFSYFGIHDVDVKKVEIDRKINGSSDAAKVRNGSLSKGVVTWIHEKAQWYLDRYF